MESRAYKTWKNRMQAYAKGEPIPKAIINAACGIVRRSNRRSTLTEWERGELVWNMDASSGDVLGWRITDQQSEQGLRWLRSTAWRHLGAQHRAMVEAFDHWTFDGLCIMPGRFGREDARPVYRLHAKDGQSFAYYAYPWREVSMGHGSVIEVLQ